MDIKDLRTVAIERAKILGDTTMLLELLRANDLNSMEAEFLADLFERKVKIKTGPKPDPTAIDKRVAAVLMEFWRKRDSWKPEAILKEIEDAFGVSRTMARKYLKDPQTRETAMLDLSVRESIAMGGNDELIAQLKSLDLSGKTIFYWRSFGSKSLTASDDTD
ncbi:MAG: hypothetical protein AAF718_09175 [Pseudomonadota bacterium]